MENTTSSQPPDVSTKPPPSGPSRRFAPSDIAVGAGLAVLLLGALAYITLKGHTPGATAPTGADAPLSVEVFRHPSSNPSDARPVTDRDTVAKTDGFTFALHNRTNQATQVMLFGMDSADTIYWFFPQGDPQKRATSLPLGPIPTAELSEGVTPGNVPAGIFRFVTLFTSEPITIQEAEDAYRQSGPTGMAEALHATMQVVSVKID